MSTDLLVCWRDTLHVCLFDQGEGALPHPGGMTTGFEDASGSFTGWGAAVDYCIAQGTSGVCPLATYCPNGPGGEPAGGRRPGDQWSPYIAPGRVNRWVQVGTMGGDPANTCDPDGPAAVGDTIHSDAAWAVEAVRLHDFCVYVLFQSKADRFVKTGSGQLWKRDRNTQDRTLLCLFESAGVASVHGLDHVLHRGDKRALPRWIQLRRTDSIPRGLGSRLRRALPERLRRGYRNATFAMPFAYQMYHFTKTGSGQT
jgi:hypothetical protein